MDASWIGLMLFAVGLLTGFFFPDLVQGVSRLLLSTQSPGTLAQESLRRLNQAIFSCFIESAYPDNLYLYERRIHIQKKHFMVALLRLVKKGADQQQVAEKLSREYAAIMTYSQLRWRVTDFTIFAVCRDEFSRLSQATTEWLLHGNQASEKLAIAIGNLEDIFQQIIKVTSSEPLVFMLFIGAVKEL